jgi:conjugal transfer/type IV secretion protein DotA/TraY
MNDNRRNAATTGQRATDEAKSVVLDDLVGRKEWQGSKLGYLTGFSVISDGISRMKSTFGELGRSIKTFYGAAVGTEDNSKLPALDAALTDESEKFEEAVRIHDKSPQDLSFMMQNSHRGFFLYAAFLALVMVLGTASLRYGNISGLPLPLDVAIRFALIPALFALSIRYGYLNWILRHRRLGSFKAYLISGDIFPSKNFARIATLALLAVAGLIVFDPGAALAQATAATSTTPIDIFRKPGTDDVFVNMLGYIVPGIGPIEGSPTNGHVALGRGFMAFSAVLMLFSSMMLSWHVLVGVVASAYSGKVLGERWHQIWAPGRVVLGLGSLAPIANGYGAAQVLVVYLMVWGGNLANTIWVPYLAELGNGLNPSSVAQSPYEANLSNQSTQQDNRANIVARLSGSDDVIFQIARREICSATLSRYYEVNGALSGVPMEGGGRSLTTQPGATMTGSTNVVSSIASGGAWMFSKAASLGQNSSLSVTSTDYRFDYGAICGSVSVTVETQGAGSTESLQSKQLAAGTRFDTARKEAVEAAAGLIRPWAKKVAETYVANGTASNAFDQSKSDNRDLQQEGARALSDAMKQYREKVMTAAQQEIQALDVTKDGKSLVKTLVDEASAKGWATAGTYYITLGQVQGAAYSKATARPAFEDISLNVGSGTTEGWMKSLVGSPTEPGALSGFEAYWNDTQRQTFAELDPDSARAGRTSRSSESPLDGILKSLGTDLLMTTTVKWMADINPYNPMKSMIDFGHLILNTFYWILALMIGAKLLSMFGPVSAALGKIAPGAAASMSAGMGALMNSSAPIVSFIHMILIAIFAVGIIHAYVLPMVPFIQVLFFIIGLLTLLIEALIAAPLWAFFHIRMDGQELVDNVQRPGYMIAFNLLLRPALMILGLIMSMFVFGAVSWFIAKTYTVAVVAAGGEHSVGPIGTIVMLVILTFLHYQTALRSFSLINQVPDRVTRWFGHSSEGLNEHGDNERAVGFAVGQIANRTESTLRAGGVGGAARNGTPGPKLPGKLGGLGGGGRRK